MQRVSLEGSYASSRARLAYGLVGVFLLAVVAFWGAELEHSLSDIAERREELLQGHQQQLLEHKATELRTLFQSIYQSARTISLLPMVREVTGSNRHDANEDVVVSGRLSLDAHRTLQQIYTNLANSVSVSEVYYVLDGFDPGRDVPFFMYDDHIAGLTQSIAHRLSGGSDDFPEAVEQQEYEHFPQDLAWFRAHAPRFRWSTALADIPVRISHPLRSCDNTQYPSISHGNVRDTFGIVYAMPVYAEDTAAFKGMITIVLRTNALEARLIGVPYLPITPEDRAKQQTQGWSMPAPVSFRLEQPDHDINIIDRRHPLARFDNASPEIGSREAAISLDFGTGELWTLRHTLSAAEVDVLSTPLSHERRRVLFERLLLLALFTLVSAVAAVILRRSHRELVTLANFDTLTTLPNRRLFFEHLQRAVARAARSARHVALFYLNVSDFKAINEVHGVQGGDRLLASIAKRLQENLRTIDIIESVPPGQAITRGSASRVGGDEFIVLCEDIRSADDVPALADRLVEALSRPFRLEGIDLEVSASMGIALYPGDAADSDKLLQCADMALHESRRDDGKYVIFNEALRHRHERQHVLAAELKAALAQRQFALVYQPKASLRDGSIISLEALLRWHHPKLGLIPPNEFIPILERKGGILEVGEWVIEQACRDLSRLAQGGVDDLRISVNVSVRQLRLPDLALRIAEILKHTQTAPDRLILEITESMVMENFEEGRQALQRLKNIGASVAIDDFGTGYSSLTYLQHLPLDYLKLDRGFVDDMNSPRVRHIVESVIRLARGLSLQTIAEGIETAEQRDILAALGCDMMQGYLLSKPLPLNDIANWLQRRTGAIQT